MEGYNRMVKFELGVIDSATPIRSYVDVAKALRDGHVIHDIEADEYRAYYADRQGNIRRQYIPIDESHLAEMDDGTEERGDERMEFVMDTLHNFPGIEQGDQVSAKVPFPYNSTNYITFEKAIVSLMAGKVLVDPDGNKVSVQNDGMLSGPLVIRNINKVECQLLEDYIRMSSMKPKTGYSRIGLNNKY